MDVIPVVDLACGQVVHARMGERDGYRPIATPLARTSDPVDVVAGLMALHPFPALYAADLDAILGRGDNLATLRRLRAAFPALTLWIDNGAADADGLAAILEPDESKRSSSVIASEAKPSMHRTRRRGLLRRFAPRNDAVGGLGVAVLGSESQRDGALIAANRGSSRVALSLDFRHEQFVGPPEILEQPDSWPGRVIVMTLARVGGRAGPDFDRLGAIRENAGGRAVYAAGGVRDGADLARLKSFGCAGALVATALHDGRLGREALDRL